MPTIVIIFPGSTWMLQLQFAVSGFVWRSGPSQPSQLKDSSSHFISRPTAFAIRLTSNLLVITAQIATCERKTMETGSGKMEGEPNPFVVSTTVVRNLVQTLELLALLCQLNDEARLHGAASTERDHFVLRAMLVITLSVLRYPQLSWWADEVIDDFLFHFYNKQPNVL